MGHRVRLGGGSTLWATEYASGRNKTVYVREILRDLGLPHLQRTTLGVDNKGAIQLAKECKITHQSRHITRRHLKIREYTHDEIINVKWVPTLHNISDLCTKPLDKSTFLRHRDAIMPPMHTVAAHASLHVELVHA